MKITQSTRNELLNLNDQYTNNEPLIENNKILIDQINKDISDETTIM